MTRSRSPNYPSITIEDAVGDAKKLWDKISRTSVTPEELAKHLDFKGLTGSSRPRIAALKKYGIVEKRGGGLALTDRAVNIAVRETDSPEYKAAVKDAVYEVDLFADLIKNYASSSQKMIEQHLVINRTFTPEGAIRAAEAFLAAKKILSNQADSIDQNEDQVDPDSEASIPVKTGDFVQWTNMGVAQFVEPRKVLGISPEGDYAFLEGTKSGVPVKELETQTSPTENQQQNPPANPFSDPATDLQQQHHTKEHNHATLPLESGQVSVQWPNKLTLEDYEDIKAWLKILERKIGRSANAKPECNHE